MSSRENTARESAQQYAARHRPGELAALRPSKCTCCRNDAGVAAAAGRYRYVCAMLLYVVVSRNNALRWAQWAHRLITLRGGDELPCTVHPPRRGQARGRWQLVHHPQQHLALEARIESLHTDSQDTRAATDELDRVHPLDRQPRVGKCLLDGARHAVANAGDALSVLCA